jgi:hypothetical protein
MTLGQCSRSAVAVVSLSAGQQSDLTPVPTFLDTGLSCLTTIVGVN